MALDLPDLLDPVAVARLGHLELVARTLVDGFLKGAHFSASKGSSTEFAAHRPYVPGDEVRRIDWRTYARTDRFYLKEYDDETNVRATLVVDASGSMAFGSSGITKFRYATCLAAALGHLLLRQRDAVGLAMARLAIARHIPPRSTPQNLRGVLDALASALPEGPTGLAASLHQLAGRLKSRSLVLVVSDLIDDPREILKAIAHLRHRRAEAILFQILDPAELDFPFTNWTVFRDAEDPSRRLRLDGRQVRDLYRENLAEHRQILSKGCAAAGADYHFASTRTPFALSLATYLDARERRAR